MKRIAVIIILLFTFSSQAFADEEFIHNGEVKIPLDQYAALVNNAETKPKPAPSGFALGQARVNISAREEEDQIVADVNIDLGIRILENEWTLVPILPSGTAIYSAAVSGRPVELITTPSGLAWGVKSEGSYNMRISYKIDAHSSKKGFVLPIALPEAASITLNGNIPGTGLDLAIIPGEGTTITESGSYTSFSSTIPANTATQISWRSPNDEGYTISRAKL